MKFSKKKDDKNAAEEKTTDKEKTKKGFAASKRLIIGGGITLVLLLIVWTVFGLLGGRAPHSAQHSPQPAQKPATQKTTAQKTPKTHANTAAAKKQPHGTAPAAKKHVAVPTNFSSGPKGIAFVEACIKPLDYELNHRFWGWRPNDVIDITDNVNNIQKGVLEVTRRTSVALAENLSRTGSTDSYVLSLEYAMNWFMIKPTKYWFPSAESKYKEGLNELRNYIGMLKRNEANFYTRMDNIVPLLKAYESILGSCDENLVKELGEISFSNADNYFYYAKGVASSMQVILKAIAEDFDETIASVQGDELIHHAIDALGHAAHMDPIIVLEGSPSSLLANHRANMAAPISHARFYISVLVSALTGNIS